MELELHQIELKYKELRIISSRTISRLMASLNEHGQLTPVLVIRGSGEQYILVDGYHRVEAIRRLKKDTVKSMVASLNESEALLMRIQTIKRAQSSALEEGWLIEALVRICGLGMRDVAINLQRSSSWVFRRIDLVKIIPVNVQQLVRCGKICPYVASKYLVPMARAKKEECERFATEIAGQDLSVREVEVIYRAWRQARGETRLRIVRSPLLFLKAVKEKNDSKSQGDGVGRDSMTIALEQVLVRLSTELQEASRLVQGGLDMFPPLMILPGAVVLWDEVTRAFVKLTQQLKEVINVEQRDANSD
jgi:ParB/RepB/Spo0J family partition protein